MVESIQHVLDRVRSPRVQITYDVEIGGAIERKELPFVVGVIADLAGKSEQPLAPYKSRKFVEIDRDNFDEVMAAISPRVAFEVQKTLGTTVPSTTDAKSGDGKEGEGKEAKPAKPAAANDTMTVALAFKCLDDFSPINVVHQVPVLEACYQSRVKLNDLIARVDSSESLHDALYKVLSDADYRKKIVAEAKGGAKGGTPEIDQILEAAGLLKGADEDVKTRLRGLLIEFGSQAGDAGEIKVSDVYFFTMKRIAYLDGEISKQLDQILHHPDFQRMEGGWRGLHYLVFKTETGTHLKIRFFQTSWKEFSNDLERAIEFDQSQMFKKIYEEEYGTFGGHPYSCLVLDFPFSRNPKELDVLGKFAGVAAAAHAPCLTQADPKLFGLEGFAEIGGPRDLAKIFESTECVKWNSFRAMEDSRYVSLLLPRVLMRTPYGRDSWPIDEFDYEESVDGTTNNKFCWGNPAYVMAQRITNAYAHYGWTAAIRGVEGGGAVEQLPTYTFKSANGDAVLKCPTEVVITDRREKELSDLGFLALCHCKNTDYAAFFGGQTAQKPKIYNTDEANANALISTRLPYMLNASRFAHYIKAMMRDKVGSFMSRDEVEILLQTWLGDYVLLSDIASQESKAQYPLREGRVVVKEVPGRPGSYKAVLFLRPHFQLEELSVSLRLVARLPQPAS